ncbi:Uncharacterized protein Fot_41599 [Forsythia ovata]|uniref:Uncharacterized protein n=1 Tax=Forsythia ovata TaxID=205694 RepID=A0ABD1RIR5_9LAMI
MPAAGQCKRPMKGGGDQNRRPTEEESQGRRSCEVAPRDMGDPCWIKRNRRSTRSQFQHRFFSAASRRSNAERKLPRCRRQGGANARPNGRLDSEIAEEESQGRSL